MRRSFPFLIMLLAQIINLMIPVCVVRCIGANGHECMELAGQDCVCCVAGVEAALSAAASEPRSTCCDCSGDSPSGPSSDDTSPLMTAEACGCQHSMMDTGDQIALRSVSENSIGLLDFAVLHSSSWSDCADLSASSGLRQQSLRLHLSPHLPALATAVLRV